MHFNLCHPLDEICIVQEVSKPLPQFELCHMHFPQSALNNGSHMRMEAFRVGAERWSIALNQLSPHQPSANFYNIGSWLGEVGCVHQVPGLSDVLMDDDGLVIQHNLVKAWKCWGQLTHILWGRMPLLVIVVSLATMKVSCWMVVRHGALLRGISNGWRDSMCDQPAGWWEWCQHGIWIGLGCTLILQWCYWGQVSFQPPITLGNGGKPSSNISALFPFMNLLQGRMGERFAAPLIFVGLIFWGKKPIDRHTMINRCNFFTRMDT